METVSSADREAVAKRLATRPNRNVHKATHVFYHDKHLKTIPKIKNPTHVMHAFFHNNQISRIENLELMYNLTHLHLQWNHISSIQGLNTLCKLRKLYIGNNRLELLSGLEGLRCLEELRCEKQTGGPDPLCAEPRCLAEIAATLSLLDVSDNRLESLLWIKPLRCLEVLIARNNKLEDFNEVSEILCIFTQLTLTNFTGNPMCKKHRYRETMVARCSHLRILDGANITGLSRSFLQRFDKACRLNQLNGRNSLPMTNEGLDNFFELSMIEGPRTKSAYTLRPEPGNKKTAVPTAVDSSYNLVPRCFWRNRIPLDPVAEQPPEGASPQPHKAPSQPDTAPVPSLDPKILLTEQAPSYEPQPMPRKGILKKPMPMKYI